MRRAIRIASGLAAGLSLTMAATADDVAPLHTFYWSLPKTVLDVTLTYTLAGCKLSDNGSEVRLTLTTTPTITAKSVIDPDLGPSFPNHRIEVPADSLISFWKTASITRKVYASGILQTLSAKPQDQTGPIIGNFLTAGVRMVSVGLGVPLMVGATAQGEKPAHTVAEPGCGAALDILNKQIPDLQQKLTAAKTSAEQTALTAQIQKLRDGITISFKTTIDPAATGTLKSFSPTEAQVRAAGWYNDLALAEAFHGDEPVKPLWDVDLVLSCPGNYPQKVERALPPGTLFRDVPLCGVEMTRRGAPDKAAAVLVHQDIAFGQFGIGQRMPLQAGLFENFDWNFTFGEDGRLSDAAFTTSAKGLAASTLVNSAAGATSSIDSLIAKAAAADPETTALLAENAKIKAEVDNLTLKAQLEGLKAKNK